MRIYKYPVDPTVGEYPKGAKFLSAIMQYGEMVAYAAVDPLETRTSRRQLTFIGTGWDIPEGFLDEFEFIGTLQDGGYVWHIFVSKEVD